MKRMLRHLTAVLLSLGMLLVNLPAIGWEAEAVPDVSAKACVLMDALTGLVLYEKCADEKRPMASTTKIMTVLLTLESGNLDDPFVVDREAIHVEGSSMGLQEGDIVTKRALCVGMLLPSGNDAANAAAKAVGGTIPDFLRMMNARAAEIGMTHTCFGSPSGLDAEGHGASAYDMALLAREALRNPDFAEICSCASMTVKFGNPPYPRTLYNTNRLLKTDETVIGVKTGFTDAAGRCLVSASERGGRRLICVTLFDRNDWADHAALYDYGFSKTEDYIAEVPKTVTIPVEGGDRDTVGVYVKTPLTLTVWHGKTAVLTETILLPPFRTAPLKKGDIVGEIVYRNGKIAVARLPLCVNQDVNVV